MLGAIENRVFVFFIQLFRTFLYKRKNNNKKKELLKQKKETLRGVRKVSDRWSGCFESDTIFYLSICKFAFKLYLVPYI